MTIQSRHLMPDQGRGRPLVMLAILLSVWVGARVIMWESPIDFSRSLQDFAGPALAAREAPQGLSDTESPAITDADVLPGPDELLAPRPMFDPLSSSASMNARSELTAGPNLQAADSIAPAPPVEESSAAAGHQLLWMAAMAHLPVPQEIADRANADPVTATLPQTPSDKISGNASIDRWSMDGWALWREGSNSALVAQGRAPTYGASQAGAVLRYRLSPQSGFDPNAYVRLYRALVDNGESEAAVGASARLVAALPVRAHAELRVTRFSAKTEVRPSAFVTTELPPVRLPLGLRAEAYAQGGYVAGKNATGHVDGQLHVLRDVKRFDLGALSLGAASWGGAQEGAERIDVGPSARLDLSLGEAPARVSLDYRERVAGDAEPASGVAVTLSTRF